MPAEHTLHVALTRLLIQRLRDSVATGRDTTVGEVMREALHLPMGRDAGQKQVRPGADRPAIRHG